jgi:hypothetical protein
MRHLSGAASARGFAFAVLGIGGATAVLMISIPQPVHGAEQSMAATPAQVIASRFPPNWGPMSSQRPAGREETRQAISNTFFNPNPTYTLASVSSVGAPSGLPERATAYADPDADRAIDTRPAVDAPAAVHAPAEKPAKVEKRAAPVRPVKQSSAVFNDTQIASIRTRLKLSSYQERMWPSVEAALRNISYKKDTKGSRMATVDPNSPGVQQLKSAAFPMIMSFSGEQKDEVRQLARLMGLEQVASSF